MTEEKLYKIRVRGIVQGVFFRKSTFEKATQLGLSGFVKNEEDGSVFIEARGTAEDLNSLLAWCNEGPPRAEVEAVDFHEAELKDFDGFSIKR